MYNPDFIVPLVLVGILCLLHIFFTNRKNKSDTRQHQQEQDALNIQISTQEETFQKISAEIHDNISLTLSLSRLYLNDIDPFDTNEVTSKINLSVSLIRKAIEDLNHLSKSLSSDAVEKFGLVKALEEQVNDIRRAGLFCINYNVQGIPRRLPAADEITLFRIVQESLNNIIRHAFANTVHIEVEFGEEDVALSIRDDGAGFNIANEFQKCGSGLGNMRKRARLLNGKLSIHSSQFKGTHINITVPLTDKLPINAYRNTGD